MKRTIFTLIMGLMLSVTAFAQKTVAVYVTSSDGVSQETKRILGSELVAAITKTNEYVAVERTADFMAQVSKEQGNYEIDDAKLYDLGRKFGASNVCVADVTKFGDDYYIVARLLDIKTSKVWRTSKKYAKLTSLRELVETSEALAKELFEKQKEFSTYAYGDNMDNNSYIVRIENRGNYTKVTLKYVSVNAKQQLSIDRNTYIEDLYTHQKYQLTDAANINMFDQNNRTGKTIGTGVWEYSLFFDRIADGTQTIRIIEPNGRKYNDIVLKPYDDDNTFVFEDNTQRIYANKSLNYKQQLQEQGSLTIHKKGKTYYMNDRELSKQEYQGYIEDCPEAWSKYKKGKTWNTVGYVSLGVGVAFCALEIVRAYDLDRDSYQIQYGYNEGNSRFDSDCRRLIYWGIGGLCAGAAVSVTSFIIGNNHKSEAYKEYNNHCAKPATLSMGITSNGGVGFTLNF